MDAIAAWIAPPVDRPISTLTATPASPTTAAWTNDSTDTSTDWTWEVPDLLPGGAWYTARLASLRTAIANLLDAALLWKEGLTALDIHRGNYTAAGPQRSQLLWWEFPLEHQAAVRVGSSLNFLITPSGELRPNGNVDDPEQLAVAIKFIDGLVRLGVLVLEIGIEGAPLRMGVPRFGTS
jgi:hypothetical protein